LAIVRTSTVGLFPEELLRLDPYTGDRLPELEVPGGWRGRLRALNQKIHTGEAGGILGQSVAFTGCLGAVVLVWTGFALAWRRFFFRKTSIPVDPVGLGGKTS
jgi:uncharacterized iron-regulated membrane protein